MMQIFSYIGMFAVYVVLILGICRCVDWIHNKHTLNKMRNSDREHEIARLKSGYYTLGNKLHTLEQQMNSRFNNVDKMRDNSFASLNTGLAEVEGWQERCIAAKKIVK